MHGREWFFIQWKISGAQNLRVSNGGKNLNSKIEPNDGADVKFGSENTFRNSWTYKNCFRCTGEHNNVKRTERSAAHQWKKKKKQIALLVFCSFRFAASPNRPTKLKCSYLFVLVFGFHIPAILNRSAASNLIQCDIKCQKRTPRNEQAQRIDERLHCCVLRLLFYISCATQKKIWNNNFMLCFRWVRVRQREPWCILIDSLAISADNFNI